MCVHDMCVCVCGECLHDVCMSVCMLACVHVHACVSVRVSVCLCVHVCTCVWTLHGMHVRIHVATSPGNEAILSSYILLGWNCRYLNYMSCLPATDDKVICGVYILFCFSYSHSYGT